MDSRLENSVFECPRGFSKEDVASQLYLEDLNEDSELWLVRMPSHVDPSALENQQIDLNSDLNKISNGENNFECISERCKMPSLSLVLPKKESKRLTRVKKTFQGSLLLYDTLIEDDDLPVKIQNGEEDVPEEVNGEETAGNFAKPQSKKHRQHKTVEDDSPVKMEVEEESVPEENNEEADDSFAKPKSKKKHRHILKLDAVPDESDISSRNEESETGTTKKKKKKKSTVKLEPSSEGDEFPNCVSQQN